MLVPFVLDKELKHIWEMLWAFLTS